MISRKDKKCRASRFRQRIMIQDYNDVNDGQNGFTAVWFNVAEIWCEVLPVKAAQVFQYRSINAETSHIVKINGQENRVNSTMRFLFKTRIFEILADPEDLQERGIEKVIMCKEVSIKGDEPQV